MDKDSSQLSVISSQELKNKKREYRMTNHECKL
jgi:hypothetical protein